MVTLKAQIKRNKTRYETTKKTEDKPRYFELWQDAAKQLPLVLAKLKLIEDKREEEKKLKAKPKPEKKALEPKPKKKAKTLKPEKKAETPKPKPEKKAKVGGTAYINFVKDYAKRKNIPFKEAMKKASKEYQKTNK